MSDGTVTAGNAPGITDGAAATVVASERAVERYGLKPLARIVGYAQAEVEPKWLFLAPVKGVQKLLARIEMPIEAFDLIEINEAFAAQVLADGRELGFDWSRVNVNGGAIALGHPIGASGARIVATLLHELQRREGRYGLATLCLGGGGSVAMAFERV
jgi:acetyl-CoA C-acetyltransferase